MECSCFQLLFFRNNCDKRDFTPSLLFPWAFVDSKLCAALWVGIIACYIVCWPFVLGIHWFSFPWGDLHILAVLSTKGIYFRLLPCMLSWVLLMLPEIIEEPLCQEIPNCNVCGSDIPVLRFQVVWEATFEAFSFPVSDLHFRYLFQLLETLIACDTTCCVTPLWKVYLTVITSVYKR